MSEHQKIPTELFWNIIEFSDLKTILTLQKTCKNVKKITNEMIDRNMLIIQKKYTNHFRERLWHCCDNKKTYMRIISSYLEIYKHFVVLAGIMLIAESVGKVFPRIYSIIVGIFLFTLYAYEFVSKYIHYKKKIEHITHEINFLTRLTNHNTVFCML